MRALGLLTMTALILTGLPPTPIAPAPAEAMQSGRRAVPPRDDPDRRCAPFLQAFGDRDDRAGRGRGQSAGNAPAYAPQPSPPPVMPAPQPQQQVMADGRSRAFPQFQQGFVGGESRAVTGQRVRRPGSPTYIPSPDNRERYEGEAVAAVQAVADAPVSTFSIDVDTGSYANVRRLLNAGTLPPQAAVRTEEMLNYFRYDYPAPRDRARPFSVSTDMTTTPWNPNTRLLRVGLRGYDLPRQGRPAANLVFLVDVSGSMDQPDKLPLVQCSLALLAERLNPRDRVSIVVYAGAAGVVLEPTADREAIHEALMRLKAGGSTAGAQGIALAYRTARQSMIRGGINRVILATDGDFNVGVTNNEALIDMVERERESGITLTTLGFGTGNYNEAMMEQVADRGNGNYSYIDSPREASKVLDEELASTLFTIAHDVKIQIEFNPAFVSEYRLIGYENRALREEDFSNDSVDAGEIGAGHQVTALYEIVPAGSQGWLPGRYFAENRIAPAQGARNGQMAHLRLRYKLPGEGQSRLIEQALGAGLIGNARAPAGDSAFAAAVAAYGQLLRGDTNMGRFGFADVRALAGRSGSAGNFWRREFIGLTERAERQRFAGR